jgi:hypothetical protein
VNQRPEGTGGGYHQLDPNDGYDIEPWRPGDPSPSEEAPRYAAEFYSDNGDRGGGHGLLGAEPPARPAPPAKPAPRRVTTRHTVQHSGEARPFKADEQVRSRAVIAGQLGMDHVPIHTNGRVLSTRQSLTGDSFATVAFANGYIEEIATSAIEHRSWWG